MQHGGRETGVYKGPRGPSRLRATGPLASRAEPLGRRRQTRQRTESRGQMQANSSKPRGAGKTVEPHCKEASRNYKKPNLSSPGTTSRRKAKRNAERAEARRSGERGQAGPNVRVGLRRKNRKWTGRNTAANN